MLFTAVNVARQFHQNLLNGGNLLASSFGPFRPQACDLLFFHVAAVARPFQPNLDTLENFMLPIDLPVLSDQER